MRTTIQQDKAFASEISSQLGGDCSWVVEFVRDNFMPEQVFDSDVLEEWADESDLVSGLRDDIARLEKEVDELEQELESKEEIVG